MKTTKRKAVHNKNNSQALEPKASYPKAKTMPRYAQPLQSKTAKPKPTQALKTQQTKRVRRVEVQIKSEFESMKSKIIEDCRTPAKGSRTPSRTRNGGSVSRSASCKNITISLRRQDSAKSEKEFKESFASETPLGLSDMGMTMTQRY